MDFDPKFFSHTVQQEVTQQGFGLFNIPFSKGARKFIDPTAPRKKHKKQNKKTPNQIKTLLHLRSKPISILNAQYPIGNVCREKGLYAAYVMLFIIS